MIGSKRKKKTQSQEKKVSIPVPSTQQFDKDGMAMEEAHLSPSPSEPLDSTTMRKSLGRSCKIKKQSTLEFQEQHRDSSEDDDSIESDSGTNSSLDTDDQSTTSEEDKELQILQRRGTRDLPARLHDEHNADTADADIPVDTHNTVPISSQDSSSSQVSNSSSFKARVCGEISAGRGRPKGVGKLTEEQRVIREAEKKVSKSTGLEKRVGAGRPTKAESKLMKENAEALATSSTQAIREKAVLQQKTQIFEARGEGKRSQPLEQQAAQNMQLLAAPTSTTTIGNDLGSDQSGLCPCSHQCFHRYIFF